MQFKNGVFCLFIQFLGQFIKIDGHFFRLNVRICLTLPVFIWYDKNMKTKERATTINTKRMFSDALIALLDEKPLSKITVTELINYCGVNHKTFYYHFSNIYDLVKWMLEYDIIRHIQEYDLLKDYTEVIHVISNYTEKNKLVLHKILKDIGREQLRILFYDDFISTFEPAVLEEMQKKNYVISKNCILFLVSSFSEFLSNIIIDCINGTIAIKKEDLIKYMEAFIKPLFQTALKTADKKAL